MSNCVCNYVRSTIRASITSEAFTEQLSTAVPSPRSSSTRTVLAWSRWDSIPPVIGCVSASPPTAPSRNRPGNESPMAMTPGNHARRRSQLVSFIFSQRPSKLWGLKIPLMLSLEIFNIQSAVIISGRNRAGHIYFHPVVSFYLSFFPRLISAAAGWMSTILWHIVWP